MSSFIIQHHNVVIIADSIIFDCPNVNANYSTNVADFVGTVSEPLNIPKDEWQYMKDENGNGLPDFFENIENWSKLADSDGDGLPDNIEEYLGSDPNNIDTDGGRRSGRRRRDSSRNKSFGTGHRRRRHYRQQGKISADLYP